MLSLILTLSLLTMARLSNAKCPVFFEDYNMACYYYGKNAVTSVHTAEASCKALGGYLININAELEYSHTIDRIKATNTGFDGYWTGGVYMRDKWYWKRINKSGATEYDLMDPSATHYHWGPNEPWSPLFLTQRYAAIMVRGRTRNYHLYSENENLQAPVYMSYICEANWEDF